MKDKINDFLKRFSSPDKNEKAHKTKLLIFFIFISGIVLFLSNIFLEDEIVLEDGVAKRNNETFAIQNPKDYSETLVETQQRQIRELEKKLKETEIKSSAEISKLSDELDKLRKENELQSKRLEFAGAGNNSQESDELKKKLEESDQAIKSLNEKIELLFQQNVDLKKRMDIGEEARKGLSKGQPVDSVVSFGQQDNINQNSPLTLPKTTIEIPPLEQKPPVIKDEKPSSDTLQAIKPEKPKPEPKIYTFSNKTAEEVAQESEYVEDEKDGLSGYLPMGSFAEIVLMTGLDAGASTGARANPQPVLFRFQDAAFLPGDAKYRLESCMGLASAYGDASAERVYIQVNRISCLDSETDSVVESQITGYLVDSDGNLGFRGKLERRSGALIAKAILAGFTQGLSEAFTRQNSVEMTSAFGTTSSVKPDSALSGGLFGGSAKAAELIARRYLQEANSIFPVIEVQAGRKGHMVMQKGQFLKWVKIDEMDQSGATQ